MSDLRFEVTVKKKQAVTCKRNRERKKCMKKNKRNCKESKDEREWTGKKLIWNSYAFLAVKYSWKNFVCKKFEAPWVWGGVGAPRPWLSIGPRTLLIRLSHIHVHTHIHTEQGIRDAPENHINNKIPYIRDGPLNLLSFFLNSIYIFQLVFSLLIQGRGSRKTVHHMVNTGRGTKPPKLTAPLSPPRWKI